MGQVAYSRHVMALGIATGPWERRDKLPWVMCNEQPTQGLFTCLWNFLGEVLSEPQSRLADDRVRGRLETTIDMCRTLQHYIVGGHIRFHYY